MIVVNRGSYPFSHLFGLDRIDNNAAKGPCSENHLVSDAFVA